jgi:acetyl-CoA carboxylase biotin carboxyl carrier protein
MKLRIAKSPPARGAVQMAPAAALPAVLAAPAPAALPAPAPAAGAGGAAAEAPRAEPPRAQGLAIKSPMVGTFYASAEPGAKPYVSVGQRVSSGQVVCIIEAMKIMNEIESEYDGVVTEVLAENAHAVEYGQVLYRVDPNG